MHENEISQKVIGCAIEVHRQLGPGLLESVYEEALCYELSQAGLRFQRQEEVSIKYKGVVLRAPLRLDLIVEGKVIIDNKSKADFTPMDKQRLLTYLRLRGLRLGLLINFNVPRLVDGVHRVVDQLEDGSLRPSAPPRSPRFSRFRPTWPAPCCVATIRGRLCGYNCQNHRGRSATLRAPSEAATQPDARRPDSANVPRVTP